MNPLSDADTGEKRLFQIASEKLIPVNGSIEVTPLCTMDCDMCFVRLSREEMEAQGRLRTAEEWLSIAREMKDAGVLFMLLTGGEPLLYPGFKELYLGLRKMGFILTLNTNGTLIDEEWADFFKQNPIRRYNITLYGVDDGAYQRLCHFPGGFDRTIKAIRLLQERGLPVKLNYSLTRINAPELDAFLALCRELELHSGIDPYMMPATRERARPYNFDARVSPEEAARYNHEIHRAHEIAEEAFLAYCRKTLAQVDAAAQYFAEHPEARRAERSGCLAGRCSFTLNWQGQMRPCVILTAPAVDVFEQGFDASWKQIVAGMETLLINEDCSVCPRRVLCDICPGAALYETGSHAGKPDYLCRYASEKERLMREELANAPPP